mmetsp:Transcript_62733/g.149674  ORF Transcript_62733/g.149674 Transcript_62733/m.149674 type:complete len:332 (-) Transcript_62733:75-1070(-)
MELNIPSNLSGLAIAEPLALDVKHDGRFVFTIELLRCYLLLFLQYAIQVYFIYQIAAINTLHENPVACSDDRHDIILEMVSVFVFILAVWDEFDSSLGTLMMLWSAPSTQLQEKLREKEPKTARYMPLTASTPNKDSGSKSTSGAVLEATHPQGSGSGSSTNLGGVTSFVFQLGKKKAAKGMKQWSLDEMGRCYKGWSLLIVGLPKIFTTVCVGYFGGLYICYSEDREALLQNTLAMTFVVEVEYLLFKAFTPVATSSHLEHAKGVPVELNNTMRFMLWFLSAAVYPVLTMCSTVFIVLHANQAPLHYKALLRLVKPCDADEGFFGHDNFE